jgi:hypothetical protein
MKQKSFFDMRANWTNWLLSLPTVAICQYAAIATKLGVVIWLAGVLCGIMTAWAIHILVVMALLWKEQP